MPTKKRAPEATLVANTYWEWHQAFRAGMAPPIEHAALVSLCHLTLDAGADPDEALSALKALRRGEVPTKARMWALVLDQRETETFDADDLVAQFLAAYYRTMGRTWQGDLDCLTQTVRVLHTWRASDNHILAGLFHRAYDTFERGPFMPSDIRRRTFGPEDIYIEHHPELTAEVIAWRVKRWGQVRPS